MKLTKYLAKVHPVLLGTLGFFALLGVYFGILSVANSPAHAISQFKGDFAWVLALSAGFGIQLGLYGVVVKGIAGGAGGAKAAGTMAASGGVSTGGMVACCAHHVTDVLPFLGLTFLSGFFYDYKPVFFSIGLFSSALGIIMMLQAIKMHKLDKCWILKPLCRLDLDKAFKIVASIGAGVVLSMIIYVMSGT